MNEPTIGELQHRVDIDAPVDTQDSNGDPVKTWVPITGNIDTSQVWSKVEPLRGRELVLGGTHLVVEKETLIVMRWSPLTDQITAKHRLRHQGTVFNIKEQPTHLKLKQQWLFIRCTSGVNDG